MAMCNGNNHRKARLSANRIVVRHRSLGKDNDDSLKTRQGLQVVEFRQMVRCKQGTIDPELAEAIGIREALSWVKNMDWQNVVLETDCLVDNSKLEFSHSSVAKQSRSKKLYAAVAHKDNAMVPNEKEIKELFVI
ncbi:hypothetical protein ACET3Z_000945 [Daucus carota]